MGRSRAPPSAEEDPNQRSKRKKSASTGGTLESVTGQGTNESKRALYHCNYCNKDISGKIRIKCVNCPDFDLCIECFSVGAEVTPHKSNHNYRVMDNLSFPLICADWNADEEILLLEGIEMYGLGNWTEVAEHVGTKSKAQCIDHYTTAYLNCPCFPLPDMSHAVGKNRKELLAMAEDQGFPVLGKLNLKEESPFCPFTVKAEDLTKGRAAGQSSSSLTKGSSIGPSGTHTSSASTIKKTSNTSQIRDVQDAIKVEEDSQIDRSIGGKKPRSSMDEGPSLTDLSGYNPKRQEFDPEYDNDAEQSLAEMEFKETDTEAERELKLQVLRIYIKRLDERKRRKDFILERNLLYPNPFEKNLSPEEKEICQRLKVFMRFHSKEEHQCLLQTLIEDHRARKRIQDLQEARAAGCHTSAEADRYLEQKRKKEAEESSHSVKDSAQVGPNVKVLPRVNHLKGEPDSDSPRGIVNGSMESGDKDSSVAVESATLSSLADWDIAGLPGTDLLSETEKRLCCEIRLLPSHYLKMQRTMSMEIFNGNIIKKSDAHGLFKVNPRKVDKVYDMLVKKGVVSA